jgi:biotin carboxylase
MIYQPDPDRSAALRRDRDQADRERRRNIFVMGLDDAHRRQLESLRDGQRFAFHALLGTEEVIHRAHYDIDLILDRARRILAEFPAPIDGIIGHWDFPVTSLVPLLCAEQGLPAPSLESVCKCTHKYWSRRAQVESIPECTPRFQAIDPFDPGVLEQIELPFPFWLKPIKAYGSALGFQVDDREHLASALDEIRGDIEVIGRPYDRLLELMGIPPEMRSVGGTWCLIEELVQGRELAPEGHVYQGEVRVHGLIDMPRHEGSFDRYEYPADVPGELGDRILDVTRRVISHIGYDHGAFNIEYFYDEAQDRLSIIEINPRISQSHSYIFDRVDGVSNHEVAVKLAIGEEPHRTPRSGSYGAASKCMLRSRVEDGIVRRCPSDQVLDGIRRDFPGCEVEVVVDEGTILHDLPGQDSYSYILANLYVCGADHAEMMRRYDAIVDRLDFELAPIRERA